MVGAHLRLALIAACALSGAAGASPAQDYMLYCMGCHGARAEGVPGKVPPLAHTLGLYMRTPAGRNYVLRVPGAANSVLSDSELAAVLNWLAVNYSPGESSSEAPPFTPAEVAKLRHVPLVSVLTARREVIAALAAAGQSPPLEY
jgi:mono/diheme cytochrome c family protein